MKKLVKELEGVRKPIPKPTKVIDSKKSKKLAEIHRKELKHKSLDEG